MIIKKKKSLEAGCGAGRILRYYHEKNFDIIGIDFISEAINKLKDADQSLKVECVEISLILILKMNILIRS